MMMLHHTLAVCIYSLRSLVGPKRSHQKLGQHLVVDFRLMFFPVFGLVAFQTLSSTLVAMVVKIDWRDDFFNVINSVEGFA